MAYATNKDVAICAGLALLVLVDHTAGGEGHALAMLQAVQRQARYALPVFMLLATGIASYAETISVHLVSGHTSLALAAFYVQAVRDDQVAVPIFEVVTLLITPHTPACPIVAAAVLPIYHALVDAA